MNDSLAPAPIRLTEYSHGGGCGCKIAPAVLSQILVNSGAARIVPPELLVGT
ncbi:MAG: selenide, water dikinase SelD, partial [Sulfuriferula sp.]